MTKITLERELFADRLSKAVKFVPTKPSVPAMDNFLLQFNPIGDSWVAATNGNIDIKLKLPIDGKQQKETVTICVPAKLLLKTVSLLRENTVTINIKAQNLIEIVSGKSKYKINLDCPPESFPMIQLHPAIAEITMNQKILKMGLQGAESFVDDENAIDAFKGINIAEIGQRIIFTGTTPSLMCRVSTRPISITSWKPIVLHTDTASKVAAMMTDERGEATVTHSGDKIYFSGEGFFISACSASIKFPNTENLFSRMPSNTVTLNTTEMLQATKRLKLYGDDVTMKFDLGQELVITSQNSIGNDGEEVVIPIEHNAAVNLCKGHHTDEMVKILSGIGDAAILYHYSDSVNVPSFVVPKVGSDELNMFTYLIACLPGI